MKRSKCLVLSASLLLGVFALPGVAFAATAETAVMETEAYVDSWILEEPVEVKTEYEEFADLILDTIITDGMTDEEKCAAVYDYVHAIPYVNVVYSEDWQENGYRMLHDRAGDCFGYYAASRLLLEELGYQVIELQNINGFTHVWCLVSIDHGHTWRHFDPTCWSWGSDMDLCLLTDEELTEYGTIHQVGWNMLSHDWDRQQAAVDIGAITANGGGTGSSSIYVLFPEETADGTVVPDMSSVVTKRAQAN